MVPLEMPTLKMPLLLSLPLPLLQWLINMAEGCTFAATHATLAFTLALLTVTLLVPHEH